MNNHWLRDTEEETILPETIAAATAAHTRYLSPPAATTLHGKKHQVSCSGFLPNTNPMQQSCGHYTAFCSITWQTCMSRHTWQPNMATIITHTWTTTGCRTQRRNRLRPKRSQPQPPHTRGTFHRRLQPLYTEKHKVSYSGFLPNTGPMQQSCRHYIAFCNITCLTRMSRHTWPQNVTTIMRPLHCELRPEILQAQKYAHMNNHPLQKTEEEPITPETIAVATAAHTRYLSSPAATTLRGENTRFCAPAFSPTQTLCNSHAAITMRFAASHGKPACLDTRGHKTWQLPCSHYTAICNQRFNKRIGLRTTHTWATTRCRTARENRLRPKRSQPQPPHKQKPFIAAVTLHRKTQGFVLRLPPQNKPHAAGMQPLECVLQHHASNPHVSTYMATEHGNNHAASTLRSATRDSTSA